MIISEDYKNSEIKKLIGSGGVGAIPTDTLYGLVGSAFSESAVERIYAIKKRDTSKPLIVLISDFEDLNKFEIKLDDDTQEKLKTLWSGPVSVILPISSPKFKYLTRGGDSIAFRLPKKPELLEFLKEVGPIVAPSANPEGSKPAENLEEIKSYFGDSVDFIIDGGIVKAEPSTLLEFKNGEMVTLRGKLPLK